MAEFSSARIVCPLQSAFGYCKPFLSGRRLACNDSKFIWSTTFLASFRDPSSKSRLDDSSSNLCCQNSHLSLHHPLFPFQSDPPFPRRPRSSFSTIRDSPAAVIHTCAIAMLHDCAGQGVHGTSPSTASLMAHSPYKAKSATFRCVRRAANRFFRTCADSSSALDAERSRQCLIVKPGSFEKSQRKLLTHCVPMLPHGWPQEGKILPALSSPDSHIFSITIAQWLALLDSFDQVHQFIDMRLSCV